MRHLKQFLGAVVAALMVFAMTVTPAFAEHGTNSNSGSITIDNAEDGHTYSAYQVLVLESYNTDANAYSYKAANGWGDWLKTQTKYVNVDADGYVTWVQNADAAAFAKAALAHAEANKIAPTATQTAASRTVTFSNLNLGYYLVDTTLGTLCSLDTTVPNATMHEKNEVPSQEKEVQEDSDGSWGDKNTAEIGDTVNFRTTIQVKPGAESYVLHDVMTEGLTLDPDSVTVANLNKGTDYTVATGTADGCTFEVTFSQTYLDSVTADTKLTVTYNAVLNEDAKIYTDAETNKTWLDYGDDTNTKSTPPSETKTYTFKVDVVKTDEANKVLDGAQFKLYDAKTGGNEIALVEESAGVYRLATDGETGVEYITTVNGELEIKGFDANTTYWLEETKAPDGYNKLPGRVEIAVKNANIDATVNGGIWQGGGIHVVNKAGSLLPTTGGMGTTIFYVAGGAIVIAVAATLVYRKRMESNQ